MAKSKTKTSAAGRRKRAKPQYMLDPAQIIDHLLALHRLQGTLLESLKKTIPRKPK